MLLVLSVQTVVAGLSEICSEGYFPTNDGCGKCPSKWRNALQLVGLIAAVLILFVFLSWKQASATSSASDENRDSSTDFRNLNADDNENGTSERTNIWLDPWVAFIRIGFVQVMNGITTALA